MELGGKLENLQTPGSQTTFSWKVNVLKKKSKGKSASATRQTTEQSET